MSSEVFKYGQICWAKLRGFSEWPCMVNTYDSDTEYWRLSTRGAIEYYVEFFGENFEFCWVTANQLRVFEGNQKPLNHRKGLAVAIKSANYYFDKDLAEKEDYFNESRLLFNTSSKKKRQESHQERTFTVKKFDQRKYLEKYNIIDSWVSIKRITDEEINNLRRGLQEKTNTTENGLSDKSQLPKDITDLIKSTTSSQSFSNVDDISVTPRAIQLKTLAVVSSESLSNGENSSSYKTCRPPLSEQSSGSSSINSGFNLEFCSDINPTIFNLITDSDDDNSENRNMIFSADEYLIKSAAVGIKTTTFSNFAERL